MWRMLSAVVASSALLVAVPAATATRPPDLPDLVPSKLKLDVARGEGDCGFSFTLTIKNKGRADAGPYVTDFSLFRDGVSVSPSFPIFSDGTPAHGKSVFSLGVGSGSAGTYQIVITVNRFNPIPESDFTNNTLTSKPFACPAD